jgi:hypothetical protein
MEIAAQPNTCPVKISDLSELMRRDLPSYANRLFQRQRKMKDAVYSSMVAVGEPELDPLQIKHQEYTPIYPQVKPEQIFISTLERQYNGTSSVELQQFHWLFIAKTRKGWRLVTIYSRLGTRKKGTDNMITPPIESSHTVVGQSVRTWLNDCYLGKIPA